MINALILTIAIVGQGEPPNFSSFHEEKVKVVTIIKEVPIVKEVIKEVIKEVPVEVVKEFTKVPQVCPHCKELLTAPVRKRMKFQMMDRTGTMWENDDYNQLCKDVTEVNMKQLGFPARVLPQTVYTYAPVIDYPIQVPIRSFGGGFSAGISMGGCAGGQCGR